MIAAMSAGKIKEEEHNYAGEQLSFTYDKGCEEGGMCDGYYGS
jgi:hypothetical protein